MAKRQGSMAQCPSRNQKERDRSTHPQPPPPTRRSAMLASASSPPASQAPPRADHPENAQPTDGSSHMQTSHP